MTPTFIIGGGIIGLSTAYRLAKARSPVTLLERHTLGSGATLASLGALWPARPSITGPLQNFQRQSLWMFESFLHEISADSGIPIPFRRLGHLELLTSEKAAADAQRDASLPTNWPTFNHPRPLDFLPPGAQGAIPSRTLALGCHAVTNPHRASGVGESRHAGKPLAPPLHPLGAVFLGDNPAAPILTDNLGLLHSHVTAQVDVSSYIQSLAQACRNLGVTLLENTPLTSLSLDSQTVTTLHTPQGPIDTRHANILITAGAWTSQLHPLLAASAPTRPVKGQALEVQPLEYISNLIIKRDKTYIVPWQTPGSPPRVLIGATTEKNAGFDTSAPPETAAALLASAAAFCPALLHARILRTWAGTRPDAPKHRPIMGKIPSTSNLFVSAGHYKTGIALSPLASLSLTALLLHQVLPTDLTPFTPKLLS